MKKFITAEQAIQEAFDTKTVRGLFKELYQKSPVGKLKFQEISKGIGEEKLMTIEGFTTLAHEVGFTGISREYDSNQGAWLSDEYEFDGLLGLANQFSQ